MYKTIDELKNELLSLNDVCEILKVKPRTIYNWIYMRKIQPVRVGRSIRFRRTMIDNFLKQLK